MGRHNKQYTKEFKQEAIRLYETSGKDVQAIEADLGIAKGLLNKWQYQQRNSGAGSFVGRGGTAAPAREVESLRQERDI